MKQEPYYKEIANLLKAMAHPMRLAILHTLAHRETCVCHLAALFGKRQPYISQHLMVLREAGLVRDRREGLMVYYGLSDPQLAELIEQAVTVVRRQGKSASLPPVTLGPIAGCPCPQCAAHSAAQDTR